MTVENVSQVLNMIEGDKWELIGALGTPRTQLEDIHRQYSTDAEKIHAFANYCVNYHPEASWKFLTGELYYKRELSAARRSKLYMLTGMCHL